MGQTTGYIKVTDKILKAYQVVLIFDTSHNCKAIDTQPVHLVICLFTS